MASEKKAQKRAQRVSQNKKDTLKPWVVKDGERKLVVTFASKVTTEQVGSLGLSPEDMFICLDAALDDSAKLNIMRGLRVKVV